MFVLGCGRSGTHWLGHILECYPDIRITIEKNPQFSVVQSIVTNMNLLQKRFPALQQIYMHERQNTPQKIYADKSHPNIFLAGALQKVFPNSKFIGIQRSSLGTISSMLRHQGVLQWHKTWKQYPIPNFFLGINQELAKIYDQISIPQQCAFRWLAHKNQMQHLKHTLGDKMLLIDYEDMQANFDEYIQKINNFLGVEPDYDQLPTPRAESLGKWKKVLEDGHVKQIAQITGENIEELMAL